MDAQTAETRARAKSEARVGDSESRPPDLDNTDRSIGLLIFLASLAYLYLFRLYTMMDPDEGIILQGAERILHGQMPYRDFFSFYTPGSYYVTAAALKLLGDKLESARMAVALGMSVVSALTYLVARRVCSRGVAAFTAALATLTVLPFRDLVLHNWDSTVWAMLALYVAVRYLEASGTGWAFALGSLTAATALCEQSKGAGLALGLGLSFGVLAIASRRRSGGVLTAERASPEGAAMRTSPLQHVVAMVAGLACPFVLVVAWFWHQHALAPMLSDLLWPLHHYSRTNSVPYGYQSWSEAARKSLFGSGGWGQRVLALVIVSPCFLVPVLPLVAVGIFARLAHQAAVSRTNSGGEVLSARSQHYLLVSGVSIGLLFSVVAVRADIVHFMYVAPMLYLVLAWILDGRDIHSDLYRALRPWLRVLIVACFPLFVAALATRTLTARVPIQTHRGEVRAPVPDQVLPLIQSQVSAGSTTFVYPYLPLYYYLTATFAPGPQDYLQPGMHTGEQQAEMIRGIAADRTPMVLYEYGFDEKIANSWPRTPLDAIARDPVADFLLAQYHGCSVVTSAGGGRFLFMVRKDLPCPAR